MRTISVLGSTGSIGTQTRDIVREHVWEEEKAKELKERVADPDTRVTAGMEGLLEAAVLPEAELLVTAIVGMIGIRPTMAALEAGKDIALANKETLVTAGHLIMPLAAGGAPGFCRWTANTVLCSSAFTENPEKR